MKELFVVLGKPYVLDILYVFAHESEGPVRFARLKRRLGLSANTLSLRLKELVALGILSRTVLGTSPPVVEYAVAARGRELAAYFEPLHAWAHRDAKAHSTSR